MPVYRDPIDPDTGEPLPRRRRPLFGNEHLSLLGIVVLAIALIGLIIGFIGNYRLSEASKCRAAYFNATTAATRARVQAADVDRTADKQGRDALQDSLDALVDALNTPPDTPAEQRRQIAAVLKDRFARNRDSLADVDRQKAQAEQIRDANPLPPQPNC